MCVCVCVCVCVCEVTFGKKSYSFQHSMAGEPTDRSYNTTSSSVCRLFSLLSAKLYFGASMDPYFASIDSMEERH